MKISPTSTKRWRLRELALESIHEGRRLFCTGGEKCSCGPLKMQPVVNQETLFSPSSPASGIPPSPGNEIESRQVFKMSLASHSAVAFLTELMRRVYRSVTGPDPAGSQGHLAVGSVAGKQPQSPPVVSER